MNPVSTPVQNGLDNNTCSFCKKSFACKRNLTRHLNVCPAKSTVSVDLLQQQISTLLSENANLQGKVEILEKDKQRLQEQLFEIAKQPKTNNNNNQRTMNIVNQLAPYDLNADTVKAMVEEHFDKKCFMQGIDGITKMVAEELLTDKETGKKKMLCTDLSRRKVKYVIDGKVVQDVGMQKTLDLLCPNLLHVNMLHSKREGPPGDDVYLSNAEFIRDKSKMCSKIVIHFIEEPVDEL